MEAKPALFWNSSSLPDHSNAFRVAIGVRLKRLEQHWSQTSQESRFLTISSIWSSVRIFGSARRLAIIRAS